MAIVPGIVLAIGGLFPAVPAIADSNPDVAITPLVVTGRLGAQAQQRLEADLVDEVGRPGLAVVSPAAVRAYTTEGSTCQTAECTAALGRRLGVEHVMHVALTVDAREYELSVRVLRGADGAEVVHESARCEICGLDEVADELVALASRATTAIPPPTTRAVATTLSITSEPVGAAVFLDGRAIGVTPTTLAVDPGPHAIKLEKSGHITEADAVQVDEQQPRTVAYVLAPVPVAPAPIIVASVPLTAPPRPRVRLLAPIGWALTGAGVASLATGAALIAIDREHTTRTQGVAVLTAGITGVGVGLTLGIVGTRWQRDVIGTAAGTRARPKISAAPGGVVLRF